MTTHSTTRIPPSTPGTIRYTIAGYDVLVDGTTVTVLRDNQELAHQVVTGLATFLRRAQTPLCGWRRCADGREVLSLRCRRAVRLWYQPPRPAAQRMGSCSLHLMRPTLHSHSASPWSRISSG